MDFGKRREGRGYVSVSIVMNAQRTREILLARAQRERERENKEFVDTSNARTKHHIVRGDFDCFLIVIRKRVKK
jgi:hypothetical protein